MVGKGIAGSAWNLVASAYRDRRRRLWQKKLAQGAPIDFRVAANCPIRLWPQGEVPELMFVYGFETLELALWVRLMRAGARVVDVGANVGLYAILASKKVGPTGRVFCFEPARAVVKLLRGNLELNGCQNVDVREEALAEGQSRAGLLTRDRGAGDAEGYLLRRPADIQAEAAEQAGDEYLEQVRVSSLDLWWADVRQAVGQIDFMKVDVEGGELRVFEGAVKTLGDNRGVVVMFECERRWCERFGHQPRDVLTFLESLGLHTFGFDPIRKQWVAGSEIAGRVNNLWAARDVELLPRM